MKTDLYSYQQSLVNGVTTDSCGLYVKAGKGKTVMSLTLFDRSPCDKLLVVCPNSKIDEWVEDVNYELGLNLIALNKGTKKNIELLKEDCDGYVIMYENVTRVKREIRALIAQNWYIILDESHSIKNSSKSSRAILTLGKRTKYKCILSGTPQSKGWEDYINQLNFLGATDLSITRFKEQYCNLNEYEVGGYTRRDIVGYKDNISEIEDLLHEYCVFYFPEDSNHEDILIPIKKHLSYDIMRKKRVYNRVRAGYQGVLHQYLKQLSSGFLKGQWVHTNKLDAFEDIMRTHIDDDIVVFYELDEEAYGIQSVAGRRPVYHHNGSIKTAKEYCLSDRKENAIILVQYKAGGTGLNWLIRTHVAWFNSLPDRHPPFEQARKRLDRVGQTRKCIFYIPITTGTIERANYEVIKDGIDFDDKRQQEALSRLDAKSN